jgi:hypothetical protein
MTWRRQEHARLTPLGRVTILVANPVERRESTARPCAPLETLSSPKKLASIPDVLARSNQYPAVILPQERHPSFTVESLNNVVVPRAPNTPACASGVPGGLVVTRGGNRSPFTFQFR